MKKQRRNGDLTLSANFYFAKVLGWQAWLEQLRKMPASDWRERKIDQVMEDIMFFDLCVRPIPRAGLTLEEERRLAVEHMQVRDELDKRQAEAASLATA